jgi:hypothetical protein
MKFFADNSDQRNPLPSNPPELPSEADVIRSFDARVWAAAFVKYVKAKPSIATNEETMKTWFAAALMRGYDERAQIQNRKVPRPPKQGSKPRRILC